MKSLCATVLALSATLTSAWQLNIGSTRAVGNQGWPCQSIRRERRDERDGTGNTFYDWDPTFIDAASAASSNRCNLLLFDNANCYHGKGTAFERHSNDPFSGPTRGIPGIPLGSPAAGYDIKAFEVFCYDRGARN
jgi:hypothetical protein